MSSAGVQDSPRYGASTQTHIDLSALYPGFLYVGYQINVYTREANRMAAILSGLSRNIQDAFAESGVEILSPTYMALRDGAARTTPPSEAATGV